MSDEQRIKIREVLDSRTFSEAEKFIVRWQVGMLGDFKTALIDAIKRADDGNLERLGKGFPTEVAAFVAWSRGDLALRLREAGLEV